MNELMDVSLSLLCYHQVNFVTFHHFIISDVPALLGVFESKQIMVAFPRCVGIELCALFLLEWTAVEIVVMIIKQIGENQKLIVNMKQVIVQKKFPHRPNTKFFKICNNHASTFIKLLQYDWKERLVEYNRITVIIKGLGKI